MQARTYTETYSDLRLKIFVFDMIYVPNLIKQFAAIDELVVFMYTLITRMIYY